MKIKKIFLILLVISFILLPSTSIAVFPIEKSQNVYEYENRQLILQETNEKIFMIGRITNLHIEEEIVVFNPINVWYFGNEQLDNETIWSFGHTTNPEKIFCFNNSEFKGIITRGYIFGVINSDIVSTVHITFQKEDKMYENYLTVVAAEPSDIAWMDIELQVNGTPTPHGISGAVTAGDIIDVTALAGIGYYTISLRYIPTNTLIGSYEFTGPY